MELTEKTKHLIGIKARTLNSQELLAEGTRVAETYQSTMKQLFAAIDTNDFISEMQATSIAAQVSEMGEDYYNWWQMVVEAQNFYNKMVRKSFNVAIRELEKKEGVSS